MLFTYNVVVYLSCCLLVYFLLHHTGIILETDVDFQESLLPKKKGYLHEVMEFHNARLC